MMLPAHIEEKLIPAKMAAASFYMPQSRIDALTTSLLFKMPPLHAENAVIFGATLATVFNVKAAVEGNHKHYFVVGGKKLSDEHPDFTDYTEVHMDDTDLPYPPSLDMTEAEYARFLLIEHFNIPANKVTIFFNDKSRNTSQNFEALKKSLLVPNDQDLEFYSLGGYALRTLATGRKILGDGPLFSSHNAYPVGVTRDNWHEHPVARAHLAGEAAKILGPNPLYVRLGHCARIDIKEESQRCASVGRVYDLNHS